MNKRIIFFIVLILLFSFNFVFAGNGSYEIKAPYAQPAAGQYDGWITVYTDEDLAYTYFWHCDNKGSSLSRYVSVAVNLSNPDKITFNFDHTGSDSTAYYITHTTLRSSGISLNFSGTVSHTSASSITLDPTGTITHIAYGGNIALNSIPSSIGRLVVIWGGDSQIYTTVSNIYSRLGSMRDTLELTYSEVELISSQLSNYIDDFSYFVDSILNFNDLINTKLGDILSILQEFKDAQLDDTTDLPSEDITGSIESEQEIISGTDKSDSFDDVINSVDFGQFSGGFQLFWTLVDRLFATNPVFVILTVMCLSLGLISFIFNRR